MPFLSLEILRQDHRFGSLVCVCVCVCVRVYVCVYVCVCVWRGTNQNSQARRDSRNLRSPWLWNFLFPGVSLQGLRFYLVSGVDESWPNFLFFSRWPPLPSSHVWKFHQQNWARRLEALSDNKRCCNRSCFRPKVIWQTQKGRLTKCPAAVFLSPVNVSERRKAKQLVRVSAFAEWFVTCVAPVKRFFKELFPWMMKRFAPHKTNTVTNSELFALCKTLDVLSFPETKWKFLQLFYHLAFPMLCPVFMAPHKLTPAWVVPFKANPHVQYCLPVVFLWACYEYRTSLVTVALTKQHFSALLMAEHCLRVSRRSRELRGRKCAEVMVLDRVGVRECEIAELCSQYCLFLLKFAKALSITVSNFNKKRQYWEHSSAIKLGRMPTSSRTYFQFDRSFWNSTWNVISFLIMFGLHSMSSCVRVFSGTWQPRFSLEAAFPTSGSCHFVGRRHIWRMLGVVIFANPNV